MKRMTVMTLVALGQLACAYPEKAHGQEAPPRQVAPPRDSSTKWEREIAAYEAADRAKMPAKGGILFIGSSTIKLWKSLAEDFPDHNVINRGFGGSEIRDSTHFADRIIFPYEPRQIFLRAGSNDIHGGRLPKEVANDFAEFVRVVHARLPNTEILFISVNPTPSRRSESDKSRDLNKRIRKMALDMPRVGIVNIFDISTDREGRIREELFLADRLHFNADGYKLLADRVRPFLMKTK